MLRTKLRVKSGCLAIVAAATLIWAAPATAGTVSVENGTSVMFNDSTGEANAVAVTQSTGALVVTDSAAPLAAGAGCTQTTPNQASCPVDLESAQTALFIDLGAGNDTADLTGVHLFAGVSAGPGDDTVQGTDTPDALRGGGGTDKLYGRGGNDILEDEDVTSGESGPGPDTLDGGSDNDVVYYQDRPITQPLTIDLASGKGAGDTLVGVEDVQTGPAADTVRGDGADNDLFGAGRDKLFGRGGDDSLYTHGGGRLDGGAGDDLLTVMGSGGPATKITCGTGYDFVASLPKDRLSLDCDAGRIGNAFIAVNGLRDVKLKLLRKKHVLRFGVQCVSNDGCSGRMRLLRSDGSVASSSSYSVSDEAAFVSFHLKSADLKRLARGHVFTFAPRKAGAAGFRMFLKLK
jgi:Ca2+-binding RTX toxin-like protein